MEYTNAELIEFLGESNGIEDVFSYAEIGNSFDAFDIAITECEDLNVNGILNIHKELMKDLRPDIAGKLRDCDVFIGGKRKLFISQSLLKEELTEWMKLFHDITVSDAEEWARKVHVQFESIHPFEDGNGRVGRILYNVHRLRMGLPIHVIHADYDLGGDEQSEYYKWFR